MFEEKCQNCGIKESECYSIISGLCPDCLIEYNELKSIVEGNIEKNKLIYSKENKTLVNGKFEIQF